MKRQKLLTNTSTIGIIAPSSPQSKVYINNKISEFKNLGFNIKLGKYIYNHYGYLAGEDKDRAKDLMDMFEDPDVDAIVCFRGGYGSIRMAKYLNLNVIKRNPKIFCGYSDITLLLNYLYNECNLITFHSPMVNSNFNDLKTKNSFIDLVTNFNKTYEYNLTEINNIHYDNLDNITGTLVGGNLSLVASTIGTPYEVNFKNSLLLLEDIGEVPYAIDRMLSQLVNSNKLKSCKGILLGHFTDCHLNDYSNSLKLNEVFNDILKPLNIPIIHNFPCGHSYPNLTLPIGSKVTFDSQTKRLKFYNKNNLI